MEGKLPPDIAGNISWNDLPFSLILTDEAGQIRGWNAYAQRMADENKVPEVISFRTHFAFPFEKGDFRGVLKVLLSGGEEEKRNEAIAMAADMAHEIRNPLGSIELFASLLKKSLTKEADLRKVEQIMEAVHLINERVTSLIDTMKKRSARREKLSLRTLIQDIIGPPSLREDFLTCEFTAEEIRIRGDEKLLRHFFITMVIYLLGRMSSGARLEISVGLRREGSSGYGDVSFSLTLNRKPIELTNLIQGMNFPVLHHIVQLHEGMVKLDAKQIIVSLPVDV